MTGRGLDEGAGTIESDVGSDVYQELLVDFLDHLSVQHEDLRKAAAAKDVPAARYVAHQIKGTALSFGAVRLDGILDRMLTTGKDQDERLQTLVVEFGEEIGRLQAR
jgi:HPt (histidine-containing phosphotransfer) domain-containing protein